MKSLKDNISRLASKENVDLPRVRVRVQDLEAHITGGGDQVIRPLHVVADAGNEVEEGLAIFRRLDEIKHLLRVPTIYVLQPARSGVPGADVAVVPFSGRDRWAGVELLAQGSKVVGRGGGELDRAWDTGQPAMVGCVMLTEALHPVSAKALSDDPLMVNLPHMFNNPLTIGIHGGALWALHAPLALQPLVLQVSRVDRRPSRLDEALAHDVFQDGLVDSHAGFLVHVVMVDGSGRGDHRLAANADQGFKPAIDLIAPGGERAIRDIIELEIIISNV